MPRSSYFFVRIHMKYVDQPFSLELIWNQIKSVGCAKLEMPCNLLS